jgi:Spy/CpxP family protein refolding chaperone
MKNRIPKLPALLALAALLTAGSALAGQPDHDGSWRMGPPGAEQQLARLSRELGLDREQARQMLELLQAAEADHEAIRARFFEEAGPEICAIRQNTEAEIMALLTPEQAEQFLRLKEDRQDRRTRLQQHSRSHAAPDCLADGG